MSGQLHGCCCSNTCIFLQGKHKHTKLYEHAASLPSQLEGDIMESQIRFIAYGVKSHFNSIKHSAMCLATLYNYSLHLPCVLYPN